MSQPNMSDVRWWEHPDRPCKDDLRYSDIMNVRKGDRIDMVKACASCPVFFDCLTETLEWSKTDFYGIRAGMIGRA